MKTAIVALLSAILLCASSNAAQTEKDGKIVSIGSDTMSHLMKNTAEAFKARRPDVTVEVQDPGSSAGIGAMINGQSDLCPSSRAMKPEEFAKFADNFGSGVRPIDLRVALDGIVIYVHKDNPINQLSLEQIGRIFAQNPAEDLTDSKGKVSKGMGTKIRTWGEVDPNLPPEFKSAKITLYSRNAASGTYSFFKEHALNNHDFDANSQEMPGTSSVVNGVAKDRFAIGYGGIGYKTNEVKLLPISPRQGEPAIPPTTESVAQKKYPISRALQIFIPKKPQGVLKEYLEFILSPEGQKIIEGEKVGFVGLPEALRLKELEKLK
ncbi:MAG TPA: phosphate ABC transporter substrate-binding protein [Planctomycetota bacterium]|nr:phosphate ABC transporter substrate-binding protein [Planctomycetota bacterium]